jgi:geranylgeranyl diphosphate synthase type II
MTDQDFEHRYSLLRHTVDRRLASLVKRGSPRTLHDACRYVLSSGGKRIRSSLVVLSCEAVGGKATLALDAGVAVEIMHNFTLVHDDIMDNAPSRRGRPTVHVRWGMNNALLTGDVLLGIAYRNLLKTRSTRNSLLADLFTDGLLTVCEGQALDLEFEGRKDVTVADYFRMIEKKTGRLMSMATQMGAIIGGGTAREEEALRMYGHYLGRAFQLQDDLLDVVADHKDFGKSIGGDIIEGKKTFLLLKALEHASGTDRALLDRIIRNRGITGMSAGEKRKVIASVKDIYTRCGVIEEARERIRGDTYRATAALDALPRRKAVCMLHWVSELLLDRAS